MLYRFIRTTLVLALVAFVSYRSYRFCHETTGGFALRKIRPATEKVHECLAPPNMVATILSTPLEYVGRGGQCYAFATADGEYVVKLLKYNNNYPKIWFRICPFPFGLEKHRQAKITSKKKKLAAEYESYAIASKHFAEETGILYFHLAKGDLPGTRVQIKDKIGVVRHIPIDEYQFYIQKKGSPLYPGLLSMLEESGKESVKAALSELSHFLWKRCKEKITDGDAGIWRNFALKEGIPFQIDIGQFSYESSLNSHENYVKDLLFFTKDFRNWLSTVDVELADYFTDTLLVDPDVT